MFENVQNEVRFTNHGSLKDTSSERKSLDPLTIGPNFQL
jgi:hypothetical protein